MSIIGVFDSGIGGLSVVRAIEQALPYDKVIFASDRQHVPYGDKPPEQVLGFVFPILQDLVAKGCEVIVIACNTVTTTHITELRRRIPVPLIGIEPMLKPAAALSKTGVIAVCATPATLRSERYQWLKHTYAPNIKVLEPDCSQWAYMVEHDQVNEKQLQAQIDALCDQGADVIVLGCTHYHWIEDVLQHIAAKRAVVIQPEEPVLARLQHVLARTARPKL
jgi:glutamate racemase